MSGKFKMPKHLLDPNNMLGHANGLLNDIEKEEQLLHRICVLVEEMYEDEFKPFTEWNMRLFYDHKEKAVTMQWGASILLPKYKKFLESLLEEEDNDA